MKKLDLGQTVTILANVGIIAGIVFLGIEFHAPRELEKIVENVLETLNLARQKR